MNSHDRRVGVALGWRWFSKPERENRPLRSRRILAAAVAIWVAVLGATLWQANDDRIERGRAQQPAPAAGASLFRVLQTDTPYRGDVWTTVFMDGAGGNRLPSPPGVPTFVAYGETYVSPAVQDAMERDPTIAARVPGTVVGTITDDGLQSPDQYFVYTGANSGPHWRGASGWGSDVVAVSRAGVPRWPLLALVVVLMGLPALILARATGRMSALSRQRSLAALHLVGAPASSLALASTVDAALSASIGTAFGTIASAVTVAIMHESTALGLAWFAPQTLVSLPVVTVAWLALSTAVGGDAWRMTRQDLRTPWVARAGGPRPVRRWTAVPLVTGVAGLAGIVISDVFLGAQVPPAWSIAYFFGGGLLAVAGAIAGLPLILEMTSRRLRRRDSRQTAAGFVAARRLAWRRDSIAASVLGVVIIGISGLVGAGALADLAAISPNYPQGDRYSLQGLAGRQLRSALEVDGATRVLQVTQDRKTLIVAECDQLARVLAMTDPQLTDSFGRQCTPDNVFRIARGGAASDDRVVLPGVTNSMLRFATLATADPATFDTPRGQHDIIAWPGPTTRDVDRYIAAVAAAGPQVQVTNLSADSYKPMVAPTRRLLIVCTIAGLLTAMALLVLTALDNYRRTRADSARLVALGAPSRTAALIHARAFGTGVAVALIVGIGIGLLAATVYDNAGGLVSGPGSLGLGLAGVATVISALAVVVVWITARREAFANPLETMQSD
ncbi:hypothetical protein GCM10027062_07140 [Nocardioides hungaricus]